MEGVVPVPEIKPGTKVLVRSAFGDLLERRAVTGVEPGDRFPVVWVCTEDEWKEAKGEGVAEPWPAEHVQVAGVSV